MGNNFNELGWKILEPTIFFKFHAESTPVMESVYGVYF